MGILDAPLRSAAEKVVGIFGTNVVIRDETPGAYDPKTGTAAAASTTDQSVKGVWSEVVQSEVDDAVRLDDRKLTVAAADLSTDPQAEQLVIGGTTRYRIKRVRRLEATDQPAAFVLFVRSGG